MATIDGVRGGGRVDVDAREDDARRASRMHLVSMRATGRRVAAVRDIVCGRVRRRYPAEIEIVLVSRIADAFSHKADHRRFL